MTQHQDEYISLTDMARKFNPAPNDVLKLWMRSSVNIEFLGTWRFSIMRVLRLSQKTQKFIENWSKVRIFLA